MYKCSSKPVIKKLKIYWGLRESSFIYHHFLKEVMPNPHETQANITESRALLVFTKAFTNMFRLGISHHANYKECVVPIIWGLGELTLHLAPATPIINGSWAKTSVWTWLNYTTLIIFITKSGRTERAHIIKNLISHSAQSMPNNQAAKPTHSEFTVFMMAQKPKHLPLAAYSWPSSVAPPIHNEVKRRVSVWKASSMGHRTGQPNK